MFRAHGFLSDDGSKQRSPFKSADLEPQMRAFREVVASVNGQALGTWAELWQKLRPKVAANGAVLPDLEKGFRPSGGWPEFLEQLWLLKHYLEYVQRFCKSSRGTDRLHS
ncbi:MAG: hypothetical protein ACYTG0_00860 [Planctomycetota bacterium]